MAEYWLYKESRLPRETVSLSRVTDLLTRLAQSGQDAVAESLLGLLGEHVALAQCTIFSFAQGRRPRVLAVGDRARTRSLPDIAQAYVKRFHALDGLAPIMLQLRDQALRAPMDRPLIVLHRQAPTDITHPGYRQICYELPAIAERLAVLALYGGRQWLSVHLYRGIEQGLFKPADIDRLSAFAPLMVQAVRLHHTGQTLRSDLPSALQSRLCALYPELTPRDQDVLRAVLDGLDAAAMAERLGITVSSARTYVKRLCRKLGVAGKGELTRLALQGISPGN